MTTPTRLAPPVARPTDGELAEQRHTYLDLDPDSASRPAGFVSPSCPPRKSNQTAGGTR